MHRTEAFRVARPPKSGQFGRPLEKNLSHLARQQHLAECCPAFEYGGSISSRWVLLDTAGPVFLRTECNYGIYLPQLYPTVPLTSLNRCTWFSLSPFYPHAIRTGPKSPSGVHGSVETRIWLSQIPVHPSNHYTHCLSKTKIFVTHFHAIKTGFVNL